VTDISRRAASHVIAIVTEARQVWPDDPSAATPGDTLDRLVEEAASDVGAGTVIYAMAAFLTRSTNEAGLRDLALFMTGWEPGEDS
jgi:hypothetical protein